jgi:hypothetical protein
MCTRVLKCVALVWGLVFLTYCGMGSKDNSTLLTPQEFADLDYKLFVVFESTTNRLIFRGTQSSSSTKDQTLSWKIKSKSQIWDDLKVSSLKSEFVFMLNDITFLDRTYPLQVFLNDKLVLEQKIPPTPSLTFVDSHWIKSKPISLAWSLPHWNPEKPTDSRLSLTGFQEAPGPFNSFEFDQSIGIETKSGIFKLEASEMESLEVKRTLRMRLCLKRLYAPQPTLEKPMAAELSSCSFLKNLPYSNDSKL